ncbi:MAG: transporter substrate-binding domain-containing protein [Muribaculaceae bacterium]|jgi:ABC-type amino acid transport substrate-binding protein
MGYKKLEAKKGAVAIYALLLAVALGLMLTARQCSTKRIGARADDVAGGDTLNVAIEISPTGLSLAGDTLSGIYYDLLRETCRRHGQPVKFHPYTRLEDALRWLEEGRCRLVVGDIPVTAELRDRLIFVNPVGVDKQVLVQLADTSGVAIRNQFDLARQTVYVARESPYVQRLRNLSHEIGDTIHIVESAEYSPEQLVILTALGEIPRAVVNRSTAESLSARYPSLDISVAISFNQFQSWALSPRDTLLRDTLDQWLGE